MYPPNAAVVDGVDSFEIIKSFTPLKLFVSFIENIETPFMNTFVTPLEREIAK